MRWLFNMLRVRQEMRELAILTAIGPDREMSAVQLQLACRLSIDCFYNTAERMEQAGLLVSREGEPTRERGWRRSRLYQLTQKGRDHLWF